jgi:hypothetical protein
VKSPVWKNFTLETPHHVQFVNRTSAIVVTARRAAEAKITRISQPFQQQSNALIEEP